MNNGILTRIIKTLNNEEYTQLIRCAKSFGFKVDGFKDISKVPRSKVYAVINSKQLKLNKQLVYMAEAICLQSNQALKENSENRKAEIRRKVATTVLRKGDRTDEEIEQLLEELEHYSEQEEKQGEIKITSNNTVHNACSQDDIKRMKELEQQVATLTEICVRLKDKNNRLEDKNRKLNMENEEKDKKNKKYEKELQHNKMCQDREEEYQALKKEYTMLQEVNDQLSEKMNEMVRETQEINEQLACYQEENSRKVLCFTKKEISLDIQSGYRIQCVANYDSNQLIQWDKYDDIWVITRDFGYATIREIEKVSPKVVHTFYSHKVITTV